MASGLPGKRVDAYLAGMIPINLMSFSLFGHKSNDFIRIMTLDDGIYHEIDEALAISELFLLFSPIYI